MRSRARPLGNAHATLLGMRGLGIAICAVLAACGDDAANAGAYCREECTTFLRCNPALDVQECASSCVEARGSRISCLRADYAQKYLICVQTSDCSDVAATPRCLVEAQAALTISRVGQQTCDTLAMAYKACGRTLNSVICLTHSDGALRDAASCSTKPCHDLDYCVAVAFGI